MSKVASSTYTAVGSHELPAWLSLFLPANEKNSDWSTVMMVAGLIILLARQTVHRLTVRHLMELYGRNR